MLQLIREIYQNRELIWALALKELHVRYKRSVLGFLWALLHPLFMMIILTVVFSSLVGSRVEHYYVFLISMLLPWIFFAQALTYSVECLVSNGDLLKKVRVAKSVFPVAVILSNTINFLLSLLPLALILVALRFPLHWTWVYLPIPIMGLLMFVLGCGFFLSAVNVYFRDVTHIVQIILQGWFYFSPIMFSLELLPQQYHMFFRLNPMLYILNGFRLAIYYGQLPTLQSVAASIAIGAFTLFLGYSFFRRLEHTFALYV
jgi:ABC-type polysaccharide/polyol phosphate export permease